MARGYHLSGNQLQKQYKNHWSDLRSWSQLSHAEEWLLFPENVGPILSIDDSDAGDLRPLITNKQAHGRKGCIVAIVKGTRTQDVSSVMLKLPRLFATG